MKRKVIMFIKHIMYLSVMCGGLYIMLSPDVMLTIINKYISLFGFIPDSCIKDCFMTIFALVLATVLLVIVWKDELLEHKTN